MKKSIVILLCIFIFIPLCTFAQTNTEQAYRALLVQLIQSLQTQLQLLLLQQANMNISTAVSDRCPNIAGAQVQVPTGLIYSRTFDTCVTERQLDNLEDEAAKEQALEDKDCRDAKTKTQELREQYSSTYDELEKAEKDISKASKHTLVELYPEHMDLFLNWIAINVNFQGTNPNGTLAYSSPDSRNVPLVGKVDYNSCTDKSGCYYAQNVIEQGLKAVPIKNKLDKLQRDITLAEADADRACGE